MNPSQAAMKTPAIDVTKLKRDFSGVIVTPDSNEYGEARHIHNLLTDAYPALIMRPQHAQDVVAAVKFATANVLRIAVRGGGHNNGGFATVDDGIVIDMSSMNTVRTNPDEQIIYVEGGAKAGEVTAAAMKHGMIVPFGDSPSVGVGGITLGGGVGWLTRKFGMTIDSLLAVEIVTAAGEILHANDKEHSDLFWAVRGGGGNFGVVTAFEFRMHPIDTVLGGMLLLPATRDVISKTIDLALEAPDDLTIISMVGPMMPMPGVPENLIGTLAFTLMPVWAGDLEAGKQALAPFRALATPFADMIEPMPFSKMYDDTGAPIERYSSYTRAFMADQLDDKAIDAILAAVSPEGRPQSPAMNVIQIRILGGAMARVPTDATAFAHRTAPLLAAIASVGFDPSTLEEQQKWADAAYDATRHAATGAYLNFLENEGDDRIREAYPAETYRRLAEIKRAYDPDNVFRLNQNIQPTPAASS
jgi:FAD/FMN-containing dehydrogenase